MKILSRFFLIFSFISIFWVIVTALLSPGYSIITFSLTYIILICSFIDTLVLTVISIVKKDINKSACFSLTIFLIMLIISKPIYNIIHEYNETNKYLKKTFSKDAKILSIADKKVNLDSDNSSSDCNYIFNVSLNDDTDIIFQAGYCDIGTMWTNYDGYNNYIYYYVPYYLKKYKEGHSVSFKLESSSNKYDYNNYKIIYSEDNKEEVLDFLEFLFSNDMNLRMTIKLYNQDTKKIDHVDSHDKNYDRLLRH